MSAILKWSALFIWLVMGVLLIIDGYMEKHQKKNRAIVRSVVLICWILAVIFSLARLGA